MTAPGTLFGYTESQLAGFAVGCGVVALVWFKLAIVRYLIRQHNIGRQGTFLLYAVFLVGVLSILAMVFLLLFWKV